MTLQSSCSWCPCSKAAVQQFWDTLMSPQGRPCYVLPKNNVDNTQTSLPAVFIETICSFAHTLHEYLDILKCTFFALRTGGTWGDWYFRWSQEANIIVLLKKLEGVERLGLSQVKHTICNFHYEDPYQTKKKSGLMGAQSRLKCWRISQTWGINSHIGFCSDLDSP